VRTDSGQRRPQEDREEPIMLELHRKPDTCQSVSRPLTPEGVELAIDCTVTLGIAIGLVMQRYGLTAERALAYLANVSSSRNITLSTLAHQTVDDVNTLSVPTTQVPR